MADPITWGLINGVKKGVKTVQSTLDGLLDDIKDEFDIFIGDAEEVIEKLGTGLPPRDLAAFSSQSTEDGIKLTFTPPAQTYIDDGGTNQFAVMPAGVLIRYSDTGYPRTPDEGKFGYDYKPTGDWVTTSQECTIVGLTKDTKYYFTAFPYSTEHVYNKNQVTANRTEMTWVGNKGTISVTVNTPEGYEGTLGEYTITLVDQASDSPQNVEKSATGAGLTQFGGLTAGKSYKVRLSSTTDLQAPPDSEVITIVGGVNYDVTMTYALMYGTITVNVSTQPAGMPIGQYTVTLTPNDSSGNLQQSGNNSQAVVFSNVKNGVVYTVGLSSINHYTANANGTVTAVGGQNISHNAQYVFSATLDDLSWAEIQAITRAGKASSVFDIGDTKATQCLNLTGGQINAQGTYSSPGTTSLQNTEFTLVAIDVDKPTSSSLSHSLTFFAKSLPLYYRGTSSDYNWNVCGARKYLNDNYQEILPEASPYIVEVSIIALGLDSNSYNDATQSVYTSKDKLFVPSAKNVGWNDEFGADDDEGDQNAYPYFASNTQRQLGSKWALRTKSKTISDSLGRAAVWAEVITGGTVYSGWNSNMDCGNTTDYKRPLCFCIG